MMNKSNKIKGKVGEDLALAYLLKNGYRLIGRNIRCRLGEIDLVVEDIGSKQVVIVEVKCKTSDLYGNPWQMVNYRKMMKLRRLGESFMQGRGDSCVWRIDVVSVTIGESQKEPTIEHFENILE